MDTDSRDQGFVFPPDFIWGVATSSHQVEGGNLSNQWADWATLGKI
jgi:beta-glucosidase